MTNHAAQSGTHRHAERGADLYETPNVVTEALLRVEQLPQNIWEPAGGKHAIVDVLREHGRKVTSSDVIDYKCAADFTGDFLEQTQLPTGVEMILTNPPFRIVNLFIAHALLLCPRVIMLARLALLESVRRTEILENSGLARVHVFRNRLPMMHRDGWDGPKASSATPFAWFVWDRDHKDPTTVHRISWTD